MDWALYWFMFPASILVAVIAMVCGIGGTALFTPILLLLFPTFDALAGTQLAIDSPVNAFAAALITATFGFGSGWYGYRRARLIDYDVVWRLLAFGAPAAVLGATLAHHLSADVLKLSYAALMFLLAAYLARRPATADKTVGRAPTDSNVTPQPIDAPLGAGTRVRSQGGHLYYAPDDWKPGSYAAVAGGGLTGMMSVGLGELLMPVLLRRYRFPVPVAAAVSVTVVAGVFLAASVAHLVKISLGPGDDASIPWNLLIYTVPGVLIGGQIGPRLQGRLSERVMVKIIGGFFVLIGIGMVLSVILR